MFFTYCVMITFVVVVIAVFFGVGSAQRIWPALRAPLERDNCLSNRSRYCEYLEYMNLVHGAKLK